MIDFRQIGCRLRSFFTRLVYVTQSNIHKHKSGNIPAGSKDARTVGLPVNGSGHGLPKLQEILKELHKRSERGLQELVDPLRAFASASESADPYTRGHSERVTRFSVEIAKIMGLPQEEIEQIRIGALIHDIGKISIDEKVLNKTAPLTEDEYALMKTHATRGYELLKDIPSLKKILPCIQFHHEQLDGKGYPQGLKGEGIPLNARIVTVADCFDAMITTRPYQDPTSTEQALGILRSGAGVKYDVRAVDALIQGVRTGRIQARSGDKVRTDK
jgi:HD-GYP domain-containing protein (c-di-GMP phosphodiesterase class II)